MIAHTFPDAAAWRHDTANFMYAPGGIDVSLQLAFMGALLAEFGQSVPPLSPTQSDVLSSAIERHPAHWRVVPTVLDAVINRAAIVQPHTDSPLSELMGEHAKLWTPQENSERNYPEPNTWHKLWSGRHRILQEDALFIPRTERDQEVKPQLRPYGLRYKTPEGRMKSRPQYIAALLRNSNAIQAEDGTVWTFPLMDVSRTPPDRIYKGPGELFKRLHYIISPEARLGVQVMHLIAGNPVHPDVVEITNETLSELRPGKASNEMRGAVGITRSATDQFFRLSWWTMQALPDWQLPQGTSGL